MPVPTRVARTVVVALLCGSALPALSAVTPPAQPAPVASAADLQAAWIEQGPGGPIVRALTRGPGCPSLNVSAGGGSVPMQLAVRAEPAPPAFPERVCEATLPAVAERVTVDNLTLNIPLHPKRIVVLGDTGCDQEEGQDCSSPAAWPLADLARRAAAKQPDLVIHLGDYSYRSTGCKAFDGCCVFTPGSKTCGAPDCGDTWSNWNADFFAAAQPLLAAAPWVLARGNHELCARAGQGWFRYLDPQSPPTACGNPVREPVFTPPYALNLGDLRLLVLDSSLACDDAGSAFDSTPQYKAQFAAIAKLAAAGASPHTWLVSHRPLWGVKKLTAKGKPKELLNATLEAASGNHLPAAVELLLAGHMHVFESLAFGAGTPPQLIVGSGGTVLGEAKLPSQLKNVAFPQGGPTVQQGRVVHDHSYLVIDLTDKNWTATLYGDKDAKLATCDSTAKGSVCELAGGK